MTNPENALALQLEKGADSADRSCISNGKTDVFNIQMTTGITMTPEFAKKMLAHFAVNGGIKCGHGCLYCSSKVLTRMHKAYEETGRSPYEEGFALVDPQTPERVAADARRIKLGKRGMVLLSSIVDSWAPEAKHHELGRRCMDSILAQPGWSVRILTKSAAVVNDFDLIQQHRDRVLFGMSITAPPEQEELVRIIEPFASPIRARMKAVRKAAELGFRTYGMACPLLPGIGDGPQQIESLVKFAVSCGAEEIFVEALNPRGNALPACEQALASAGHVNAAFAMKRIRTKKVWSTYVANQIAVVQRVMREYSDITRLRYLLYGEALDQADYDRIRADDAGVIWLSQPTYATHSEEV